MRPHACRPVRGPEGISVIALIAIITAVAALGLAAANLAGSRQESAARTAKAYQAFYAAQSGLQWVAQATEGYATADRSEFLSLDNTTIQYAGARGPRFTIRIDYSDPDGDPATEDTVAVTSTGAAGGPAATDTMRVLTMTITVPPAGNGALFADHYDEPAAIPFEEWYTFGAAQGPHGGMAPYASATSGDGGDTSGYFTLPFEAGGAASVLRMGGREEVRYTIHTGSCLKWPTLAGGDPCGYPGCESRPGCQARQGLNIATDDTGFVNYIVKIRARLIHGDGFGVYFRSFYPGQDDPSTIDFSGLTGYVWQYDAGLGYLAPCDMSTAVFGGDGAGMLATRKASGGEENCAVECGIFTERFSALQANPYPFFCPENRAGLGALSGWQWNNADWVNRWRTIYLYVYQNNVNVYIERDEDTPGAPERVAKIDLGGISTLLMTGDIGVRVFANALAEIDYINVWPNDDDLNPDTFSGSP